MQAPRFGVCLSRCRTDDGLALFPSPKKRRPCGTCGFYENKQNQHHSTSHHNFPTKMKVQVLTILILSNLAFAAPALGNDAGSHIDRYTVPSDESHEYATGDRFSDSNHVRGNANLRSTRIRAFQIPVEEALHNESIPSVRNRRITLSLLFVQELRAHDQILFDISATVTGNAAAGT